VIKSKLQSLNVKIDSLNPLIEINSGDDNEKLMEKIATIKSTLNNMNNSFDDIYSRKVYKNLKQQLLQLQVQLIEGHSEEIPKDDNNQYMKDKLNVKIKTVTKEAAQVTDIYKGIQKRNNKLDSDMNKLLDNLTNYQTSLKYEMRLNSMNTKQHQDKKDSAEFRS